MGCKTVGKFYIDNLTPIAIGASSNVIFAHGTISNNCLSYTNGVVTIKAQGLYLVSFNATPIATAVGDVQAILQVNGQAVNGANSSDTLAVVGDSGSLAFLVPSTLQAGTTLSILNVAATSYSVANLTIIKIA